MKRIVGILLGAMLVVAACGSDSKALSKEDFLKQGNDICKKGNETIDAASKKAFPDQTAQPDPEALKKFFNDTVFPNVKKQIEDIDALKPPKDLEADVDKLVKDAKDTLTKLQDQVNKDPQSLFSSSEDPFTEVNKQATKIGLTTCASDGEGSSSSSSS